MKVAVPNLLLVAIATETICAQGNDGDHVRALLEEKSLPYADYMDSLSLALNRRYDTLFYYSLLSHPKSKIIITITDSHNSNFTNIMLPSKVECEKRSWAERSLFHNRTRYVSARLEYNYNIKVSRKGGSIPSRRKGSRQMLCWKSVVPRYFLRENFPFSNKRRK